MNNMKNYSAEKVAYLQYVQSFMKMEQWHEDGFLTIDAKTKLQRSLFFDILNAPHFSANHLSTESDIRTTEGHSQPHHDKDADPNTKKAI